MTLPRVDRRQHPGRCIKPNSWIYEAGNTMVETLLCDYCAGIVRDSGTNLLLNPQPGLEAAKQRNAIDAWSKRFPDPRPGLYGCIPPGTIVNVPNLIFRFPPDFPGFEHQKGRPMNPSKRYRPTKAEVAAAENALRTLESRMEALSKENSFLRQSIATIGAAADKDTQRIYELVRNLAHAKGLLVTTLRSIRGPERELIRRFIDVPPFDRSEARSAAHVAADSVRFHQGIVQDTEGLPSFQPANIGPSHSEPEALSGVLGRRR